MRKQCAKKIISNYEDQVNTDSTVVTKKLAQITSLFRQFAHQLLKLKLSI
ncbi:MAG: hypothetical protein K0Q79_1005 [Flavipsychrobacter sp.]|jgi:hypothetical protein|nr:hypothetical protein [Flavipsychrobacter sp.]